LNTLAPVIVGSIGAPHGVRGWVRINSFTDPSDNLFTYELLLDHGQDNWQPIKIDQVQPHGNGFIAKIEAVNDRDQAALLTNAKLAVQRTALPELESNEYYWADLMGLVVYNQEQILLGKVVDCFATGANDVLVVREEQSGKEHLIPSVPEMYILKVDLATGQMQVRWDPEF
jgi:16S rRNA processing protein RimM